MSPFDDPVLAAKHQWCYTLGPMGEVLRTRTPDIQLFRDIFNASPSALRSRVEDITKKRKAEEARFRHSAIVESSQDAIASVTLDGVITSWNAGAQRIFGYTESETIRLLPARSFDVPARGHYCSGLALTEVEC